MAVGNLYILYRQIHHIFVGVHVGRYTLLWLYGMWTMFFLLISGESTWMSFLKPEFICFVLDPNQIYQIKPHKMVN